MNGLAKMTKTKAVISRDNIPDFYYIDYVRDDWPDGIDVDQEDIVICKAILRDIYNFRKRMKKKYPYI